MTTIVVIGSSGFTGQHVTRRLRDDGYNIVSGRSLAIDVTEPSTILDGLKRARPDVVVNLAAIATLGQVPWRRIYEVNAFGVLNLLEALDALGFSGRFITASSALVYGTDTPVALDERAPLHPAHHYSCAKALAENVCALYEKRVKITITRPFNCIGRGHRPDFIIPKLVNHFYNLSPIISLGNRAACRDYIDIRDVASAYATLVATDRPPAVVNICTGIPSSIDDVLNILTDLTGHRPEITTNPAFTRPDDNLLMYGSVQALEAIGWKPAYSLRDTLRWMLNDPALSSGDIPPIATAP